MGCKFIIKHIKTIMLVQLILTAGYNSQGIFYISNIISSYEIEVLVQNKWQVFRYWWDSFMKTFSTFLHPWL